eukprot:6198437-Pleurochrysis_carterae.AAC.4
MLLRPWFILRPSDSAMQPSLPMLAQPAHSQRNRHFAQLVGIALWALYRQNATPSNQFSA